MSIVAVKKYKNEIVIGSDSIMVHGWTQEKDRLSKMFKIGKDMVMGTAGECRIATLFKDFLSNHKPKYTNEDGYIRLINEFTNEYKDLKGFDPSKNDFIVIYNKKIFSINDGYHVREIKDYYAIGAGMDYALAALYNGCDVKKAIETACHLSIYCEKPINIIKIKTYETQNYNNTNKRKMERSSPETV